MIKLHTKYILDSWFLLSKKTYFNLEGDLQGMEVGTSYNILRPETIESFMYLWRKTGKQKYRDWGWDIFQAFETQSRTPSGYVGLRDVSNFSIFTTTVVIVCR